MTNQPRVNLYDTVHGQMRAEWSRSKLRSNSIEVVLEHIPTQNFSRIWIHDAAGKFYISPYEDTLIYGTGFDSLSKAVQWIVSEVVPNTASREAGIQDEKKRKEIDDFLDGKDPCV